MERNVGGIDRLARAVLAVVFLVGAVVAYRSGKRTAALLAAVVGAGFLQNAVTCFCGLNRLVGIDTTNTD